MRPEKPVNRRTVLKGTTAALVSAGFVSPAVAQPDNGAQQSGKFLLDGTADIIREPDVRPVNHVVRIETDDEPEAGSLGRYLEIDQLPDLEGLLGLDVNVVAGHTILSAPRALLSVDTDGDGEHDEWIFGFDLDLGPGAQGPGVGPGDGWVSASFTGEGTRWNDNRIGGGTFRTWSDVLSNWSSDYSLLAGWVVDDGYWADGAGVIHLDNVQIGNRTLEGPSDIVG